MAQSRSLFHRKNLFPVHKTSPRKAISRSPLQFDAEELKREFGSEYQTIDVRIGNLRMTLDLTRGIWVPDSSLAATTTTTNDGETHFGDETELKKQQSALAEENALLSVKVDLLLELLAQATAEEELCNETE